MRRMRVINMNNKVVLTAGIVLVLILGGLGLWSLSNSPAAPATGGAVLQVVAAENFWGNLATQLGGSRVQVTSIVTDPNADPHDYESTTQDARAVADADYVIENGAGYDTWIDKLISAGGKQSRITLNVATLVGKKEGDNPHLWYNPAYVNQAIAQMKADFIALDPADAAYFEQQYAALQSSLEPYQQKIADIKTHYAGVPVGATEDIFVYFADATGLDLTTPPAFIQAVGDGDDPPAQSVAAFQNQIQHKQIKVLVYNEQTVTPVTENIKSLAQAQNIPIVGITETMPLSGNFQDWMGAEATALENALALSAQTQ